VTKIGRLLALSVIVTVAASVAHFSYAFFLALLGGTPPEILLRMLFRSLGWTTALTAPGYLLGASFAAVLPTGRATTGASLVAAPVLAVACSVSIYWYAVAEQNQGLAAAVLNLTQPAYAPHLFLGICAASIVRFLRSKPVGSSNARGEFTA
jgi:hypothetical protein